MPLADYEYAVSRGEDKGRFGWAGTIIYRVPTDVWSNAWVRARGTAFPYENGGADSPVLWAWKLRRDVPEEPGCLEFIEFYKDLTWDEWLELHPNHGVPMTLAWSRSAKPRQVGTKLVDIPYWDFEPDGKGETVWKITSKEAVVYQPILNFRIHAVISDVNTYLDPFAEKVRSVNDGPVTILGTSYPTGHVLFKTLRRSPRRAAGWLWTADFDFICNRDEAWPTQITASEYERRLVRRPVYTVAGAETDEERVTLQWMPTGATESATSRPSVSFLQIFMLLQGGW